MKEEQAFHERRHTSEPKVAARDVRKLVANGHLLLAP
jgi:hypothetical protein